MPLYAYRCKACNHEFEKHQRMSEDPLTDCPVCGGQIRRVINSVGIVFRGSGFYVTDNKATNPAAPSKTGDEAGSKPDTANGSESGSAGKKPDDAAKPSKKSSAKEAAPAAPAK